VGWGDIKSLQRNKDLTRVTGRSLCKGSFLKIVPPGGWHYKKQQTSD